MRPPESVLLVMKGVLTLLGEADISWKAVQKALKGNFFNRLKTFDKDNIPAKVLAKTRKMTANPNFTEANLRKSSISGAIFCNWVLSMLAYADIVEKTRAMREEFVALREQGETSEASLAERRAAAAAAIAELEEAQKKLAEMQAEEKTLQSQQ